MKRVVKIGGRAQGDPALPRLLATVVRDGHELVIVHGGGDEVTALQRRLGAEPTFIGGRRATTEQDLDIVRMVLSGTVNKRLVRQLLDAGVSAIGISGEDGALLPAVPLDGGSLGAVGEPLAADPRPVEALLAAGFIPVISPVGRHAETGQGLNINGDDAAAAIAGALRADELLLLADVPGVLDASGALVAGISIESVDDLIASGMARGGMAAKLEAARRALAAGVATVRIADANALLDPSIGTRLTTAPSPA
jgi:acetylglutamate kinase